jgi:enoyl-CoA hydratase
MSDPVEASIQSLADLLSREVPEGAIKDMIGVQRVAVGEARAAVVTLARPVQLNALNLAGWRRIAQIFTELADDLTIRVVVVRGAGAKAFGVGADISEFPAERLTSEAAFRYNAEIAAALRAVQEVPVPVIAMIGGLAVGGGCELAAACDVRIASRDSRFGIPIGKLGVTLGLIETRAVAGVIGAANLKYLVYSGRLVDATKAAGWGLVQEVVDRSELVSTTIELATTIAASAEVTVRATKQITALAADPSTTDQHPLLQELHVEAYDGADLREGVSAFLIGRTPEFTRERSASRGRA